MSQYQTGEFYVRVNDKLNSHIYTHILEGDKLENVSYETHSCHLQVCEWIIMGGKNTLSHTHTHPVLAATYNNVGLVSIFLQIDLKLT